MFLNIYLQYIAFLQSKQGKYPETSRLQKRRIIPGHAGGTYKDKTNVLLITYDEHVLAHYYRFLAYGEKEDQIAYFFMRKLDADARHFKAVLGGQRSSA